MTEQPPSPAANPWGAPATPATPDPAAPPPDTDWLGAASAPAPDPAFDPWHPFTDSVIPLDHWVEDALAWLVLHLRPVFQAIRWPVDGVLGTIESTLQAVPAPVLMVLIGLVAWQVAGRRLAVGSMLSLLFIGLIGAWDQAMTTLALVFTSVVFCLILGLPLGLWLGRNDRAAAITRPMLDAMQTTPAFVYLVPIVMLFGIGNVPGVVVTTIFALPPLVRLTALGIRQVPGDLVEAARSFGASESQVLFKVQLPLALPTLMAGVNQTLMLALSMVVIASMIAVGGLGQMVLRGIGRLDMGLATVGGVGIVLLAIVLDRLTQAMGDAGPRRRGAGWRTRGPAALIARLTRKTPAAPTSGASGTPR
ncbi:glycine betaine/L-proline ABC transporter permease ProW [Pararhodospirillum oryzae]|uniref:Glycine/betaine ABC transporter permease n=1 Tax=Pararhodospirillum oryzae TaxID=478448 RepID=A0A512H7B4_9PROT|nr:glycine betaine/L-proline ABC transporter permease ProW [Pararhodospirillum oryzae]GEO81347.1 glycine/betaine ABC transporter permease [Pararhodospirillum oryzae]